MKTERPATVSERLRELRAQQTDSGACTLCDGRGFNPTDDGPIPCRRCGVERKEEN